MGVEAGPTHLEREDLQLRLFNDDISGCTGFKQGLDDCGDVLGRWGEV